MVVEHPADGGGAGDSLGGGGADRGSVFEVAAARVGGVPDPPVGAVRAAGVGDRRRPAFPRKRSGRGVASAAGEWAADASADAADHGPAGRRIAAGRWTWPASAAASGKRPAGSVGEGLGADVDDDLVEVGVGRGSDLPGQVVSGDTGQRISQVHGLRAARFRTARFRTARSGPTGPGPLACQALACEAPARESTALTVPGVSAETPASWPARCGWSRSAVAARSAWTRTWPSAAGRRTIITSDPSSSSILQVTRRAARDVLVVGAGHPAVGAGEPV